jgi:hypothetical protein
MVAGETRKNYAAPNPFSLGRSTAGDFRADAKSGGYWWAPSVT